MKVVYSFFALAFLPVYSQAQSVGIGTTTPHPSAALEVSSNNQGLLLPRLTDAQMRSVTNPQQGLLVFNTSTRQFYGYIGYPGTATLQQSVTNSANSPRPVIGQSFTATQNGRIESFTIYGTNALPRGPVSITVQLLAGDGLTGTVLTATGGTFLLLENPIPSTYQPLTFQFSNPSVSLVAGQVYTMKISENGSHLIVATTSTDVYAGGQFYDPGFPGVGGDLKFQVGTSQPSGWVPLH